MNSDAAMASSTESRQQLQTPPPDSDEHGPKVTGIEETSVKPLKPAEQAQTPNLKRPAQDDEDAETKTPSKVARITEASCGPRTPKKPAQSEEALAKKLASAKKKEEDAAVKAANAAKRKEAADAKKAEKERKKQAAQWKKDWKDWISKNQTYEELTSGDLGKHVNAKNAKAFFDLKPDELKCIPHRPSVNAFNQMPQKDYRWDDCGKLAFRKEAMLAGIPQDNEQEFLAKGKKLFADKHARGNYDNLLYAKGGRSGAEIARYKESVRQDELRRMREDEEDRLMCEKYGDDHNRSGY
ncbi:hypothetical protein J4E83_010357 [Alternaria metachromatica]|uniref:uncharacterized protein n=1 Tax=Alternaria metachromatica TaxID=283354 RepID=UPI0020C4639D|nr:uncharacterized protein J4E83_010357 [Alternaria metachromatica]KAI4605931.1 hypothetical protein J4E83_010357 [Alternaria metachromatica]